MTNFAPLLLYAALNLPQQMPELPQPPNFLGSPGIPVLFPPPPSIASVYDENQVPRPVPLDNGHVLLWGKNFTVTVTGVQLGDEVIAFLDNDRVGSNQMTVPAPFFSLGISSEKLCPGVFTNLTVRVVRLDTASTASLPVKVLRMCKEPNKPFLCEPLKKGIGCNGEMLLPPALPYLPPPSGGYPVPPFDFKAPTMPYATNLGLTAKSPLPSVFSLPHIPVSPMGLSGGTVMNVQALSAQPAELLPPPIVIPPAFPVVPAPFLTPPAFPVVMAPFEASLPPPMLAPQKKDAFAFDTLPQINPVPPMDALDVQQKQEMEGVKNGDKEESPLLWFFNFAKPAHFSYPRFGPVGEKISEEGLVIYEGMQFRADPSGEYEVRFTVSSPDMPVTLRLQLQITTTHHLPFSLTLPPFEFIPPELINNTYNPRGNCLHRDYHVVHKGYSPLIAQYFSCLKGVHRQGTARFGSYPALTP